MRARAGTARRYAKALHLLVRESGAAEASAGELARFLELFRTEAEAREALTRPWVKPADRRGIAVALAERTGAGKAVRDLLGLLAERGRMDHLPEVVEAYRAIVDEELGQARARVRTAVALTAEQRQTLVARLERALGRQIIVEETVDATLLGGFVAQVGSHIVDGSLDGQLARMRERLARG